MGGGNKKHSTYMHALRPGETQEERIELSWINATLHPIQAALYNVIIN